MRIRMFITSLLLLQAFNPVSSEDVYTINDFKRSYFKIISENEGFYKITDKLEESKNEIPLVYGFIDPDFYTDIITVSTDFKKVQAYIFDEDDGQFHKILTTEPLPGDEKILVGRITYLTQNGDFPNLLLFSESKTQKKSFFHVYQIVQNQSGAYSISELSDILVTIDNGDSPSVEPINFQISNDMELVDYWLVSDKNVKTVVNFDRKNPQRSFTKIPFASFLDKDCVGCLDFNTVINNRLVPVGSHRLADLNGDGRADFIIESLDGEGQRVFEIYNFQDSGKFGLGKVLKIDQSYSIGTFVDLLDRKMYDLVFWNKKDNKVYIHLAKVSSGQQISDTDRFSSSIFGYSLPSLENPVDNPPIVLNLIPGAKIKENHDMLVYPFIRFADLSLDGKMDMIINTVDADGSDNVHFFPFVQCAPEKTDCNIYGPEFSLKTIGVVQNKKILSSSLFDFGERGFYNQKNWNIIS